MIRFNKKVSLFIATGILAMIGYWLFVREDTNKIQNTQQTQEQPASENLENAEPKAIKQFTPQEFMSLYNSFVFPNTTEVSGLVEITGNRNADTRIKQIAESRGYKLRSIPQTNLIKYKEHFLQQKAHQPWSDIQAAAAAEGVKFDINSAFRPVDEQRTLFLSRLSSSAADIAAGKADSSVNNVLNTTSPPGYSRHHNGFTVDLTCSGQAGQFKNTVCFRWLSKNNYENAKKFGWIPSYPEGIEGQGPEPEEWEYVWVGVEALYE